MKTIATPRLKLAILLIATCAHVSWANAQNDLKNTPLLPLESTPVSGGSWFGKADCLPAKDMKAHQLFGLWRATFTNPPAGLPATATMLLERHAQFSDSLAGAVSRDLGAAAGSATIAGHSAKALLAGDLDEGMLLLDESSDGISITGTWNGEMVLGSCGKTFQGQWKDTSKSAAPDAPDVPFRLSRLP